MVWLVRKFWMSVAIMLLTKHPYPIAESLALRRRHNRHTDSIHYKFKVSMQEIKVLYCFLLTVSDTRCEQTHINQTVTLEKKEKPFSNTLLDLL